MKIITFYDQPRFTTGAHWLRQTLACWKWENNFFAYAELPTGCPAHWESPYAFKPYLLDRERLQGIDLVLWVDTSIRFMQSPDWAFSEIEKNGYLLIQDSDQLLKWWASDLALKYFDVVRQDLSAQQDLLTGLVGLDFRQTVAQDFLDQWLAAEKAGLFRGSWTNDDLEVSSDPSVKGHRHDQTCAALIARQLNLKPLTDRECGIASWSDHAARCESARSIIDRKQNCPQVDSLLNFHRKSKMCS